MPVPPRSLAPTDGRFGAGPSLILPEHQRVLGTSSLLGTSHRKAPVKALVQGIREGLSELFSLPPGYEIAIGNGGATAFWSVAAASLVDSRAKCAVFGEFGAKCAADWAAAPWIDAEVISAPYGSLAEVRDSEASADVYAYPHNETSTGVASPLYRGAPSPALTVVDATSIAGAAPVDWDLVDVYYFSPQKCFGSEGGLWLAVLSPSAKERAERLAAQAGSGQRYMPSFLNLAQAASLTQQDQTLNTPAISSLVLLEAQVEWLLSQGGLNRAADKAAAGAELIGRWADSRPFAEPFVSDPALRSPVVTTVDLDQALPVDTLANTLRQIGVVDIEGYRKLGRNQLRISSFPSIATTDIQALLDCIDWIADRVLD